MEIQPHDRILVSDTATCTYVRKKILAPLMLQPVPSLLRTSMCHCRYVDAYTPVAATMLNGRIGGGVMEWHSFQLTSGLTHGVLMNYS